jgi:hypothetical protein
VAHLSRRPQLCHATGSGTNIEGAPAIDDVVGARAIVVVVLVVVVIDVAASPTSVVHAVPSSAANTNSAVIPKFR